MRIKHVAAVVFCLFAGCVAARADSAPFGVLSAYNLVALGTTGSHAIAGDIVGPTTSDNEGRIAAAGQVTHTLYVATELGSDPWGALASNWALVAAGGVSVTPAGGYFSINHGGNAWAASNNANYWFNGGGKLTVGGASPIDFAAERTAMQTLNSNLSKLVSNGTTSCGTTCNSGWTVLQLSGSSTTLNVYTLTAAQFDDDVLDFIVPDSQSGATIIVNVLGTSLTLSKAIEINGQQESDTNDDNNLILFNFVDATSVTIDAQYDAAMLAPYAVLSGTSQMGGNFIVAAVGATGEVHNDEFTGTLPAFSTSAETPEPASLALMGTGILLMACLLWRRKHA
jgi:choice-of-anchor A domain-containing protein